MKLIKIFAMVATIALLTCCGGDLDRHAAEASVLRCKALEDCGIDTASMEMLQPAIDYVAENDDSDMRSEVQYYRGRIFQNHGDNTQAMRCFVDALRNDDVEGTLLEGKILVAQANIYALLYKWNEFIGNNEHAACIFNKQGHRQPYYRCLIRALNGNVITHNRSKADSLFNQCEKAVNVMGDDVRQAFNEVRLIYFDEFDLQDSIPKAIKLYIEGKSSVNWIYVAQAYRKIGVLDSAYLCLRKCALPNDINGRVKYYAVASQILEDMGNASEALAIYKRYNASLDSVNMAIFRHDTQFVEERLQLQMRNAKEKETKMVVVLIAIIAVMALALIAIAIYYRMHMKIGRYRNLLLQMREERERLGELMKNSSELDAEVVSAVSNRFNLLNKFIAAEIAGDSDITGSMQTEIDALIEDKQHFMNSTRLAFKGSAPQFIAYLEGRGLTLSEINICCLYAIGLRGKEVGSYIKMRSHYNISSDIRTKLGLDEHGTNLGIYIRKLLQEYQHPKNV